MGETERSAAPVRAKAIIVDPGTMTVLWANEAVLEAPSAGSAGVGSPIEQVFPLAGQLGLGDAIARVAASGEAHHVHADVIPTRLGSMVLVISVYRLPEGSVLVLVGNAWEYAVRTGRDVPGRPGRDGR